MRRICLRWDDHFEWVISVDVTTDRSVVARREAELFAPLLPAWHPLFHASSRDSVRDPLHDFESVKAYACVEFSHAVVSPPLVSFSVVNGKLPIR